MSLIPEKPGPATQLVSLDNNLENAGFESRLPGKEEGAPCRPPSHHPPPGTRPRAASSGSGRLPGALLPAATGGQETPPRRQFVVHKVSSKSLLTSGLTQSGVSRQISLPASQSSTPPRGSRPPSRPASRPTSRPASKPPSRAPSPGRIAVDQEDELGELPQKLAKLKPRFSVLAVEGERGQRGRDRGRGRALLPPAIKLQKVRSGGKEEREAAGRREGDSSGRRGSHKTAVARRCTGSLSHCTVCCCRDHPFHI